MNRVNAVCASLTVAMVAGSLSANFTSAQSSGTRSVPASPHSQNRNAQNRNDAAKQAENLTVAEKRFAERADHLIDEGLASQGEWGALVVDAATGEILYQRNADKYFVPASNMKLLTTALALATLGPEYRFRTTVETRGVISPDGMLSGDVVLFGRGDPNLSNRKFPFNGKEEFDGPPERVLAEMADAVVSHGVKAISGDIVGDDSYFPPDRYPNGWEIDDMVWEFGAAISAIVVNDNTVKLTLTPGSSVDDAVQANLWPTTPDFVVDNRVTSSAADVKSDLRLSREPGSHVVLVTGTLPAHHAPRTLVLAVEEPALHAAAQLKNLLEQRGVAVGGPARARHENIDLPGPSTILAEHQSVPLNDSVKLVNKISQNLHTEMYLRTAARQSGPWNTPEDLAKFPPSFYAQAGIIDGDVTQTDGSGLSRHDLVTPRALVAVLRYAQKQPWFDAYYSSLPIAGVDGTLEDRMKNTAAAGKIHAKSGSLEHVRTRSGYAETASGRRLIFSFLGNNQAGKNHEAIDVLDGLCVAMIEEWSAAAPPAKPLAQH